LIDPAIANENDSHYTAVMSIPASPSCPSPRFASGADKATAAAVEARPRLNSDSWFKQHSVIEIDHRGTTYQLRCTSLGKLLLTK
jgi:hemin uptake protein HemP